MTQAGFLIVVAVLVLVVALAAGAAFRNAVVDRWKAYARSRGLAFRGGDLLSGSAIFGAFDDVLVSLVTETHGSGKSKHTDTRATAFFSVPLPEGLHVAPEGLGTSLAKAFGGQDIVVEDRRVDEALRIQGRDEADVRRLFSHRGVGEAILTFAEGRQAPLVTQHRVTFLARGMVSRPAELDDLLRTVTGVARRIEEALATSPAADAARVDAVPPEPYPLPPALHEPAPAAGSAPAAAPAGPPSPPAPPLLLPPPRTPPPVARPPTDDYIARLAAEGKVDSAGQFTLDRKVAREKMARYQFRDPAEYVLALVRCAVLKGASRVDVHVDADDVRLSFDGRPLSLVDLEELYGSLLASDRAADVRARRQLALGLNAASSLQPQFARVVSGDGRSSVELECRPGEDDRFGPCEAQPAGTRIHVKARLRDVFRGRRGRIEELVASRCIWSPVPIHLNESRVSRGLRPLDVVDAVDLQVPGFRGAAGLCPEPGEGRVDWIMDGVQICSQGLDRRPEGFRAVVDGSERLDLDVSQSDVVRNEAWAEAMAGIRDAVPRVYRSLAERFVGPSAPSGATQLWARAALRSMARGYEVADAFRPGGAGEWLAALPLFRAVDLSAVSLGDLIRRVDEGGAVGHADASLPAIAVRQDAEFAGGVAARDIVWLPWMTDPRDRAFLFRLFGERLRPLRKELLKQPRDLALVEKLVSHFWS